MPNPIETVKFSLSDLEQSVLNQQQTVEVNNLLCLQSQFQVQGLQQLYHDIDNIASHQQLREEYGFELLKDLEKLSKRPLLEEVIPPSKERVIPPFKPEFYNEIKLDASKRSEDLNKFLEACSKLSDASANIEKVSALMLIGAGTIDEGQGVGALKEELSTALVKYNQEGKTQVDRDFSKKIGEGGEITPEREIILVKGKDGKITGTTLDKLGEIDGLTKEQIGFIANGWHQGTFSAGYLVTSFKSISDRLAYEGNVPYSNDKTSLFLDLSQQDKVVVASRATIRAAGPNSESQTPPIVKSSVLSVNITDLKGESFTPGLASAQPEITITISSYDRELELPKTLTVKKDSSLDKEIKTIETESQQFYLDEILANNKEREFFVEKSNGQLVANFGGEISGGVEKAEHAIKEAITAQALERWCNRQTDTELTKQKLEHIKEGIITIVAPICSEEEQRILEKNADRLVRECTNTKNLSFKQAWHKRFDKAGDAVRTLMNREDELQKIMDKYPKLVETLKRSVSAQSQDNATPNKPRNAVISR